MDMLKKNDDIDIAIDDLTVEGAGVGRYDGIAVFVPRALPGETVSARIIKVAKNYAVGRLMALHQISPQRVQPCCPVFEQCGGCTLQHMSYAAQLDYKRRYVRECFKRIGGMEIALPEIERSENTSFYRNKAAFPGAQTEGGVSAGFFAPRSHHLVAADCGIQKDAINEVKNAVIDWARGNHISAYDEERDTGTLRHIVVRQASNGDIMAGVVVRGKVDEASLTAALKGIPGMKSIVLNLNKEKGNAILGEKSRVIWGDAFITECYEGLSFRAGLTSFLQVNHAQSAKLYDIALEYADISKEDVVFDLFCGIGTISLLAAKRAKNVLGIEYVEEAVENARDNARLNGIGNAQFLAGDAGGMMFEGIRTMGTPDIVLLDPPRKGCDNALIHSILHAAPKRIVYVSCDPATLARDAAMFCTGGYEVKAVRVVDMFSHTTHVECVVLMSRVANQ
jgi:23S rRNA (uracil1939-C5)-methyltransferase